MILGILIGLILGALGSMAVQAIRRRRQHTQAVTFLATEFIRDAARHFESLSQAQTPEAWQTRRGKITVPPELAASYWALKHALLDAGRRRTPAGHHLVLAALGMLKWDEIKVLDKPARPCPSLTEVHTL